jgi:hypothetical protein
MVDPELKKRIIAELDQAISAVLRTHGDMTTKWVLLAEVIQADDGRRMVWTLVAPDVMAWDSLGMLSYATQCEQAETTAAELRSEE